MSARRHFSYLRMMSTLDATGGSKAAAAARLGVSPATLRRAMKAEGLDDYIWFPNINRRVLARHEMDVVDSALFAGHFPSQKRLIQEADRERVTNEPQLMTEAEVRGLPAELEQMAATLAQMEGENHTER